MVSDGVYTAVLDRFETTQGGEELAVLLLESEGDVVDDLAIERHRLPEGGRHPDAVFEVVVRSGDLEAVEYRQKETADRHESAQNRFDRLSERPPGSDEGSDG